MRCNIGQSRMRIKRLFNRHSYSTGIRVRGQAASGLHTHRGGANVRYRLALIIMILIASTTATRPAHGFGFFRRLFGIGTGVFGRCPVCGRKHKLPKGMKPADGGGGGGGGGGAEGGGGGGDEGGVGLQPDAGGQVRTPDVGERSPQGPNGSVGPHDNGEPGSVAPDGRPIAPRPADTGELNPAGLGGSPSFQMNIDGGPTAGRPGFRDYSGCQGTLVGRALAGGVMTCTVLTAAHCFDAAAIVARGTSQFVNVTTNAAVFGATEMRLFRNPAYVRHPNEPVSDSAVVSFTGPKCAAASGVPVVRMMSGSIAPNTQIQWASRWFRGLYPGNITRLVGARADFDVLPNDRNAGVYGGDSGGGMFTRDADGLVLAGVLSIRNLNHGGGFATNEAFAWAAARATRIHAVGLDAVPEDPRPGL